MRRMDVSDLGRRVLGESAEVSALRGRAVDLVDLTTGALATSGRAVPLVGLSARNAELGRLAPHARRSVRVLQTDYSYDPEDPGLKLSRRLGARGVEVKLVTRPSTPRTHPLLSSIYPNTLVGPVFVRAMIVDDHTAVIGGPDDAFGNRVSWRTHAREVVRGLLEVWEDTVVLCEPLLAPGEAPPLTERQLDVARLLCTGEKDKAIARLLDLSARTVEREVSTLLRVLGVSSRTEAVLEMRGRGVNGGPAS